MMNLIRLPAAMTVTAFLLPVVAHADPTTGACEPTMVSFIASDAQAFPTSSDIYADLPQTKVVFRQGGRQASCVLVRFSANANGAQSDITVRAILDGSEMALPTELIVTDAADRGPNARRFTFIFPSVTPGRHIVTMQQRRLNGTTAEVNAHNTIVWYAR